MTSDESKWQQIQQELLNMGKSSGLIYFKKVVTFLFFLTFIIQSLQKLPDQNK